MSLGLNTTGSSNIAVGAYSFRYNTTGTGNIGLGYYSGNSDGTPDQRSVIDNYATFIGYQASRSESVASTSALTNITAIGKNARVGASNMLVLGGTGADSVNVGIGTTTPASLLQLHKANADSALTYTATSSTAVFDWSSGIDLSDAGKFKISSSTALGTNDRFVIDGGGNVGLGCSDPDHIFEIGGTGTGCNTGAGSYLNAVGDLAFTANSSREWKENIMTYGRIDILSRIKNTPVRTFDWKPEYCPGGNCLNKLGFIAEEFYGVLERGDDKHVNGQDVTMALWLGMQNFINVFDITSFATGTPALVIDALGNWKIGNDGALVAKEVRTEKLCVGSVCVTEEQFRTVFGSATGAQEAQVGGGQSSASSSSASSQDPGISQSSASSIENSSSESVANSQSSSSSSQSASSDNFSSSSLNSSSSSENSSVSSTSSSADSSSRVSSEAVSSSSSGLSAEEASSSLSSESSSGEITSSSSQSQSSESSSSEASSS